MPPLDKRDLLARTPLFSQFSPEDLSRLVSFMRVERYPARRVLVRKGDPGTSMMVVLEGRVQICTRSEEGREFVVNIINPGDSSPWVGTVVNNHRIDGFWGRGRWDFRRCSPDERPEPIVAAVLTEARQLPPAALRELLGFARYLRWKADSRSA